MSDQDSAAPSALLPPTPIADGARRALEQQTHFRLAVCAAAMTGDQFVIEAARELQDFPDHDANGQEKWMHVVPGALKEIWPDLSFEARLCIMAVAAMNAETLDWNGLLRR